MPSPSPASLLTRLLSLTFVAGVALLPARAADPAVLTVEAEQEDLLGRAANIYRDDRASGEKTAVQLLTAGKGPLIDGEVDLPPGDYHATFYLEAIPSDVLHGLEATLTAGSQQRELMAVHFAPGGGYQAFTIPFTHPGGKATLKIIATGTSGYDGMRLQSSDAEKAETGTLEVDDSLLNADPGKTAGIDEGGAGILGEAMQLEESRHVRTLKNLDMRLVCDRVEVATVRQSAAVVQQVEVDKIHYKPGETVRATVTLMAGADGGGAWQVLGTDLCELDTARQVYQGEATLTAGKATTVSFEYAMPGPEFGHALRVSLRRGDTEVSAGEALFGVSRNVYRVGITGKAGPQDMRTYSVADGERDMGWNKANYANYFERFAWAPGDYSNLAPKTEIFFSGQTQYPGSITGYKNLLNVAHQYGVKGISYGKACASSLAGYEDFQRYPEYYGHRPGPGPVAEAYHTFYLERMVDNDYNLHSPPSEGGWQHWASLWVNSANPDTVMHGADAIADSIEMFGWDGVRWDGHFVGYMKPFLDMYREKYPDFVHGYNIAFANPKEKMFLPPADSVDDFHLVAENHGLMMDESIRDWSHTNYSPGDIDRYYLAITREADYIKRIGGIPLFILFDMASPQDHWWNVIMGLAGGQRYTYSTTPGDSAYGSIPKFLTRYSAYVWDDTALVRDAADLVTVTAPADPAVPAKQPAPWWQHSTWLRKLPDGRQQLLVNVLNPPVYKHFNDRVQTPPTPRHDVQVRLALPAGLTVQRAAEVSPDLLQGHQILAAQSADGACTVTLPTLHHWSIVVFDLAPAAGGTALTWPAFPLTTPVQDAAAAIAADQEAAAKAVAAKAASSIGPEAAAKEPAFYNNYTRSYNVDAEMDAKINPPPASQGITRNGILDVQHAHGPYAWLNPVESAIALAGGGKYDSSWVDHVSFRWKSAAVNGEMDDFPDAWDDLFDYDVVVIDNVNAIALGPKRRAMLAEYVRRGGSLLHFGGYFTLSLGADHNTYMEEILPITIRKYKDIVRDDSGALVLAPAKPDFFGASVDWAKAPSAFTVDTSPLDDGAEVLVRAGEHPAIVSGHYGKGRVISVLMNPHGNYPDDIQPYWQWNGWPRVLAACMTWLGSDARQTIASTRQARPLDPKYVMPDDLFLESITLDEAELTKRLKSARHNMVDAASARTVLQIAMDNRDKITDLELIEGIATDAGPYLDASFAPLAETLTKANLPFIRKAGYRVLGLSGDVTQRAYLEEALRKEDDTEIHREILAALGRIGDPACIPAVQRYLKRPNPERLLACAVLARLHAPDAYTLAMPAYAEGAMRRIHLKSGRRAAYDNLHGGTAFKLTPAQRKAAQAVLQQVIRLEADAKFDLAFFAQSVGTELSDAELDAITDFLIATDNRHVAPLAYQVFCTLPPERVKPWRDKLAAAKVPAIRLLAE